jgi:hypothetical protein
MTSWPARDTAPTEFGFATAVDQYATRNSPRWISASDSTLLHELQLVTVKVADIGRVVAGREIRTVSRLPLVDATGFDRGGIRGVDRLPSAASELITMLIVCSRARDFRTSTTAAAGMPRPSSRAGMS